MLAEKIDKTETFQSLVRACLEEAGGDSKKACEILLSKFTADDSLFESVAKPLLEKSIKRQIWNLNTNKRYADSEEKVYDMPGIPYGMLAVATRNWLEYPMLNGIKLGDATRDSVITASEMHAKEGRMHSARARMLKAVAERLPAGKQVRDVLTHEDIQKISIQSS